MKATNVALLIRGDCMMLHFATYLMASLSCLHNDPERTSAHDAGMVKGASGTVEEPYA